MSQSDLTKENAINCIEGLEEVMKAMPKSKALDFVGHFNDLFLFLEACKKKFS